MATRLEQSQTVRFEEAALLDPDQYPGELDAGKWVPVTKGTWRHGRIVAKVCVILWEYGRRHPGWSVSAADPGTKLGRNPDILRGPDVAIVRAEREPKGTGQDGWLEGAPDVAVEVLGDSQPTSEMLKKALEYLAAGGKMVWILDPDPQRLVLITPPGHVRILEQHETLHGGDALPGFACTVAEFFG